VPDTLDGRFDLLVLFSVITIYFISKFGTKGQFFSQALFDKIFLDLDLTLRELGAGDAGVHIKIKNMVNSFMGRQKIYCRCLEKNDFVLLNEALIKNVYRNVEFFNDSPEQLTNYCQKIHNSFINEKEDYFFLDKIKFPKL
jgi:cytochrome b pre-mRNA-processing protein 3